MPQSHRAASGSKRYSWTLVLPRAAGAEKALRPETMNASELMFFFGAPLAHVAAYEAHLKTSRQERAFREMVRARRPGGFDAHVGLALPSPRPA